MFDDLKMKLESKGEVYSKIKVLPNASKTQLREKMADGVLKISLRAVPEKGKANKELIRFLSKEFDVSRKNIKIISGGTSRLKLIKIKK